MAKIVDPDNLALAVNTTATTEEVEIQTGPKTIKLTLAGDLTDDSPGRTSGVTGKCLYSFLKEEWLSGAASATLRRFKFPLQMIFEGSFIWTNGWAPADQQTIDLIRDAGFQESVSGDEWACMITLGSMDDDAVDLAYYQQVAGFTSATTDFDKTGATNENVLIYDASVPTDYSGRFGGTAYFKAFLREQGKLYSQYNLLTEQGISTLNFQAFSFPLTSSTDLKITQNDAFIDTNAPYTGMDITYLQGTGFTTHATGTFVQYNVVRNAANGRWYICINAAGDTTDNVDLTLSTNFATNWAAYDGEKLIGSTYYAFNRIVTANGGSNIQTYEFLQRELRQTGNINTGSEGTAAQRTGDTINGEVAVPFGVFVGDDFKAAPGVWLEGFNVNSTNDIQHSPITVDGGGLNSEGVPLASSEVAFPFVAAGEIQFSPNLVAETPNTETYYVMYFDYITLASSSGVAITGSSGSTATFDYTSDAGALDHLSATGGGNDGSSADYILVAGFSNAENNGLWILTGDPTTNTFTATKQDGATVVDEAAGATVTVKENPYESPEAFIVDDNSGTDITGNITTGTVVFDFDYTNNNQGGRNVFNGGEADAAVIVVAQALDTAEWTSASATIGKTTGISISVNAGDERNYANPV